MADTQHGDNLPGGDQQGAFSADDLALLAQVRDAVEEHDPVPANVVAAAKASLTWRTLDAELAELTDDSALTLAGVRSSGQRSLVFESPVATVGLEVEPSGGDRRLTGQIVVPRAASVEVRHRGGRTDVEADDQGRFSVESVPAGRLSLLCHFAGESRDLVTSWVSV